MRGHHAQFYPGGDMAPLIDTVLFVCVVGVVAVSVAVYAFALSSHGHR
jgi:hypothetical protein